MTTTSTPTPKDAQLRAAAVRLAEAFRLSPGYAFQTDAGGGVRLNKRMLRDNGAPFCYGYRSRQGAKQTLADLLTFLGWAGLGSASAEAAFAGAEHTIERLRAVDRTQLELAEDVTATLFAGRMVFQLSPAASGKFVEFLRMFVRRFAHHEEPAA